jgi:hypothetical protein
VGDDPLDPLDPLDGLQAWAAGARTDEEARGRTRQRWLAQQAQEHATVTGLLLDLAERAAAVQVQTPGGRHRGVVERVGADFLALTEGSSTVLVPLGQLGAVRVLPGEAAPATGQRRLRSDAFFATALASLAGQETRVRVAVTGGEPVSGELLAVGRDVLSILVDGGGVAYVPLAAVAEVLAVEAV